MKTLAEMRKKYWSNATSLYPAVQSPKDIAVRFDWSKCTVDREKLEFAQMLAKQGVRLNFQPNWNKANFMLTGAYDDGTFYDQFQRGMYGSLENIYYSADRLVAYH